VFSVGQLKLAVLETALLPSRAARKLGYVSMKKVPGGESEGLRNRGPFISRPENRQCVSAEVDWAVFGLKYGWRAKTAFLPRKSRDGGLNPEMGANHPGVKTGNSGVNRAKSVLAAANPRMVGN
jgi:hypothetical protein